jgi:hypothetical protein
LGTEAAQPIWDQIKKLPEYRQLAGIKEIAATLSNLSATIPEYLGRLRGLKLEGAEKRLLEKLIKSVEGMKGDWENCILVKLKDFKEYEELSKIPGMEAAVKKIPWMVDEYLTAITGMKAAEPKDNPVALPELSPEQIKKGIEAIGKLNPSLERSLNSMIEGAKLYATDTEKGLVAARANFESWFNGSMENLSGIYKRNVQWISFGIGLILAMFLSVDSIALVQKLWIDPTVREALVANAGEFKMPTPVPTGTPGTTPAAVNVADVPAAGTPTPAATEAPQTTSDPADAVRDFQLRFEGLDLPLGWTRLQTEGTAYECAFFPRWKFWQSLFRVNAQATVVQGISFTNGVCYRPTGTTIPKSSAVALYDDTLKRNWFWTWLAGVLITALATVQGAPFWFDTLNKLINLRGAGARPPTTTQEAKPEK